MREEEAVQRKIEERKGRRENEENIVTRTRTRRVDSVETGGKNKAGTSTTQEEMKRQGNTENTATGADRQRTGDARKPDTRERKEETGGEGGVRRKRGEEEARIWYTEDTRLRSKPETRHGNTGRRARLIVRQEGEGGVGYRS